MELCKRDDLGMGAVYFKLNANFIIILESIVLSLTSASKSEAESSLYFYHSIWFGIYNSEAINKTSRRFIRLVQFLGFLLHFPFTKTTVTGYVLIN